jgi:hypothetical protein
MLFRRSVLLGEHEVDPGIPFHLAAAGEVAHAAVEQDHPGHRQGDRRLHVPHVRPGLAGGCRGGPLGDADAEPAGDQHRYGP